MATKQINNPTQNPPWVELPESGSINTNTAAAQSVAITDIFEKTVSNAPPSILPSLLCKTIVVLILLVALSNPPGGTTIGLVLSSLVITYVAIRTINWATKNYEKDHFLGWVNNQSSTYINNIDTKFSYLENLGSNLIATLFGKQKHIETSDEAISNSDEDNVGILSESDILSRTNSTSEFSVVLSESDCDFHDARSEKSDSEGSDLEFFDALEDLPTDISSASIRSPSPLNMADVIYQLDRQKISSMELFALFFQMTGNQPQENWNDISTQESPNTYQLTLPADIKKSISEDLLLKLVGEKSFKAAKLANWWQPLTVEASAPKTLTIALSSGNTIEGDKSSPYLSLRFPDQSQGFSFTGIPVVGTLQLEEIKCYPNEGYTNTNDIVLTLPPVTSRLTLPPVTSSIGSIEDAQILWQEIWSSQ